MKRKNCNYKLKNELLTLNLSNLKQKSKKHLTFGLFLFGITLFLWNCTLENSLVEQEKIDLSNVKTVSFKDAIDFFKSKKEKIRQKNAYARRTENTLEVTPDWNTLEYHEIAYTNAQLTTADSEINRNGEYSSELYFINVNNHIRNVIFTIWKDEIDSDGNVINGRIFFNDLEGKFIDGYIIEDGIFTKRYVVQAQTQQASFLPLFLFQSLTTEGDCWNTDTLGEFDGGILGEVVITSSGGGSGSGNSNGPGHSGSYSWYYTSGPGSTGYGGYVNGATSWNSMPTGGGGGTSSLSSGQITSAAAAILMASPVDPDENGECPEGYVLNTTTGKCDPICTGGKIYNTTTEECECPDGKVEDENGNCVDDCNTSKEDLKKVFPNISDSNASTLANVINNKGRDFGIDTKEKLQHFLAQAGHEVSEFANGLSRTESLYYTTKSRLLKVFYPYFSETDTINKRKPDDYLRNSSKVANYVYCCRMGNGNEASQEGYKYRGRGIFQLTGKSNYEAFKTWYNNKYDPDKDFVSNPSLITSNDTISILSAMWFYKNRVLDKMVLDSTATVKKVTKKVNGRRNGLKHRKQIFNKAKNSINCK